MASQCQAMVLINLSHVTCLFSLIHFLHCERRIQGGAEVEDNKIFAVYLLKAAVSPMRYIGWTCGGAIVTEWYIITSAACVQDVKHAYAIAGYNKYVRANDIDNDKCTNRTKKKVVFSCVPKSYDFEYHKIEKWADSDIAVVKVESKYDFNDKTYLEYCSYIPGPIDINYDRKYQKPGTDTIVLGWGHNKNFREEKDLNIYNEEKIKYAPLLIVPKRVCKKAYKEHEKLLNTIDRYMICAHGVGNLDDKGDIINTNIPKVDGCVTAEQKKKGSKGILCEVVDSDHAYHYDDVYKTEDYGNDNIARRDLSEPDVSAEDKLYEDNVSQEKLRKRTLRNINEQGIKKDCKNNDNKSDKKTEEKKTSNDKKKDSDQKLKKTFKSSDVGICQNDHGGPLVTWVGTREILIGVATAFIVSSSSQCKGPYLFTSTQYNSAFLDCVVNNASHTSAKKRLCDSPSQIGFHMIRRFISWADHPSGAAQNEIFEKRQQISIHNYHFGNPEG